MFKPVLDPSATAPALAAWCGLPDPSVSALLAREAFDAIVLDLQHGMSDLSAAVLLRAGAMSTLKAARQ